MKGAALGALALVFAAPGALEAQCYAAREGSPYDFAAAGGTLFATDFGGDAVGEFPTGLEYKAGSLELATWQGRKALKASSQSAFVIPLSAPLPESFTVEIGVVNRNTKQVGAETIAIYGGRNPNQGQGAVRAEYGPIMWRLYGGGANAEAQFGSDDADVCIGQEAFVRLKVDGDRVKLYADERRLVSVPGVTFQRAPGLVVTLAGRDDTDNAVYVTSIRVSGGTADRPAVPVAATSEARPATRGTSAPAAPVASTTSTPTAIEPVATAAPAVSTQPVTTTPPAAATGPIATTAQAPAGAIESADRAVSSVTGAPDAPTGLTATYAGAGRWAFVWRAVPGAAGYEVWVHSAECANGCRVTLDGLADTSVVSASTFDYTGPVTATVRALGQMGDPSPASAPIAIGPTPRYKGVYRITVSGFRVNRETMDNPLEIDGKRDEVLVRVSGAAFFRNQPLPGTGYFVESKVHGDRNAVAWSTATSPTVRIKAGTASALGGLRTGDVHRAAAGAAPSTISFPLLVWEGSLRQGGATLVFTPSIWEVDRAPDWTLKALPEPERELIEAVGRYAAATFTPTLERSYLVTGFDDVRAYYSLAMHRLPDWAVQAALQSGYVPPLPLVPGRIRADSLDDALLAAASRIRTELADLGGPEALEATQFTTSALDRLLKLYAAWAPRLAALLNNEDRPIGIYAQDGQQRFDASFVALNFERAEALASSGEELEVGYQDKVGGGDYTLFIRVERLD